jgi:hypothetical protein
MLMTTYGVTQNPLIGGGLLTRLGDYGNFLRMHRDDGMFGTTQVLTPAAVEAMRANQIAGAAIGYNPAPGHPYGMGEFFESWDYGAATAAPRGAAWLHP